MGDGGVSYSRATPGPFYAKLAQIPIKRGAGPWPARRRGYVATRLHVACSGISPASGVLGGHSGYGMCGATVLSWVHAFNSCCVDNSVCTVGSPSPVARQLRPGTSGVGSRPTLPFCHCTHPQLRRGPAPIRSECDASMSSSSSALALLLHALRVGALPTQQSRTGYRGCLRASVAYCR